MKTCIIFRGMPTTDRCADCGEVRTKHSEFPGGAGKVELEKDVEEQDKTLEDMIYINLSCTEELSREFIKIALEDIKTFDKKQHDYGSGNIGDFQELGVLVRANDKMQRLKNLMDKRMLSATKPMKEKLNQEYVDKIEIANESISDSWLDLSVYGIIARMCRNGVWPK